MALYLIRHGETALNRERVVQMPDTPLSERGLQQAALLAGRLEDAGVSRILASDYDRAFSTAGQVAESTGLPVEPEPLLRERHFGDIRGTPYSALEQNPFGPGYAPPGGESWADFHGRVDRAWERVLVAAGEENGHLAVVTHGLVLHSIAARLVTLPVGIGPIPHDGPPHRFGNTALSIIEIERPHRAGLLGCTAHLDSGTADSGTADDEGGVSGL
jgi:probable phosphoglycerate mutase